MSRLAALNRRTGGSASGPGTSCHAPESVSHASLDDEQPRERRYAIAFAVIGWLVFAIGAWLEPYDASGQPRHHGTHRQLGLPPCTMLFITGIPCPSCGMTTSLSLLMHGDVPAAWRVNWAGTVVAFVGIAGTAWFSAVAAGMPRGRIAADDVLAVMAVSGSTVAMVRWAGMLVLG